MLVVLWMGAGVYMVIYVIMNRFRNADAEKKISEWKARRETGEAAEEKTVRH